MKQYILVLTSVIFFTGCYDDRALLTDPTINPIENEEDKVSVKTTPQSGYRSHNNGYYYYDNGYYHNGYYYCGRRHTRSSRVCDDELVGSNGPLTYQNSREGMEARRLDSL